MKRITLRMEPALPRSDTELLQLVREQMEKTPLDKGFLQSILNSFPYYLLVFDEKGSIVYVNKQFSRLLGIPSKDLLSMDIHTFADRYIHSKPYDFTRLPRILAGETITGYHYEIIRADGNTCRVEFNSYPLHYDKEKQKKAGCLILISEIKK